MNANTDAVINKPIHSVQFNVDTNLAEGTLAAVIPLIVKGIFQSIYTHGVNPAKDERIKQAYKKHFNGMEFLPRAQGTDRPFYLRGVPGQGKTAAFTVACKQVAKALGAEFLHRPTDDINITDNHFVFAVLELAGEVSNISTTGIPTKSTFQDSQGNTVEYMSKLPYKMLASLKDAGFAFLLLDDFANAGINIQTSMLSALLDKQLQALDLGKSTAFGLAGNLGVSDNTKGIQDTTSITTRTRTIVVKDTLEDFCGRVATQYRDAPQNDGHFMSFLEAHPKHFYNTELVQRLKANAPHPTSRQLSTAVEVARNMFHEIEHNRAMGLSSVYAYALADAKLEIASLIGCDAATDFGSYFNCLLEHNAAPLASAIIKEHKLDDNKIWAEIFNRSQIDSNSLDFGKRFGEAVADIAAAIWCSSQREIENQATTPERRNLLKDKQVLVLKGLSLATFGTEFKNPETGMPEVFIPTDDKAKSTVSAFLRRCAFNMDDPNSVYFNKEHQKPMVNAKVAQDWFDAMVSNKYSLRQDDTRLDDKGQPQKVIQSILNDTITNSSYKNVAAPTLSDAMMLQIEGALDAAEQQAAAAKAPTQSNGSGFTA
jgi:MoxR-like ATPase